MTGSKPARHTLNPPGAANSPDVLGIPHADALGRMPVVEPEPPLALIPHQARPMEIARPAFARGRVLCLGRLDQERLLGLLPVDAVLGCRSPDAQEHVVGVELHLVGAARGTVGHEVATVLEDHRRVTVVPVVVGLVVGGDHRNPELRVHCGIPSVLTGVHLPFPEVLGTGVKDRIAARVALDCQCQWPSRRTTFCSGSLRRESPARRAGTCC